MFRLKFRLFVALVLSLSMLQACGDAEPEAAAEKSAPENPLYGEGGKSDSTKLGQRGVIEFGGEVFGDFTRDDQLESYIFLAEEGALITLDNSQKGTARELDSTLFLYGPLDTEGSVDSEPLGFDDDGGWGLHARIKEFTIPARGEYLVVIGTYAGMDRGKYRLTLACEGETCVPPQEPPACDTPGGEPCEPPACDTPGGEPCEPVCPGPDCDCTTTQEGCPVVESIIALNPTTVETNESRSSDVFEIQLTVEPTADVVVWVNSSNPDEAAVYPIKVLFCAPGFTELYGNCETVEKAEQTQEPETQAHWTRTVEVTTWGVADGVEDGDTTFELTFDVVTDDTNYAAVTDLSIAGTNRNVPDTSSISHLDGLNDDALLQALYTDTAGHSAYGYSGVNSARTIMFSVVDVHNGLVSSLYTDHTISLPRESRQAFPLGFNTEHTWPQGQFDSIEPMKSDLHHIFPTDITANGDRSSYDFGMVATVDPNSASSHLGLPAEGGDQVYQPSPEVRGDIARAHFYLVARYKFDGTIGIAFDDDVRTENGAINDTEEAVLRRWHMEDPVDAGEIQRNARIQAYQGNRNPFVDWPELVERVADF